MAGRGGEGGDEGDGKVGLPFCPHCKKLFFDYEDMVSHIARHEGAVRPGAKRQDERER
jgi:hypothetical protein